MLNALLHKAFSHKSKEKTVFFVFCAFLRVVSRVHFLWTVQTLAISSFCGEFKRLIFFLFLEEVCGPYNFFGRDRGTSVSRVHIDEPYTTHFEFFQVSRKPKLGGF